MEPVPGTLGEALEDALDRGLVEVADIVDGDLRVSSSARRNLNLRIERRRKSGFLIKRPDISTGAAMTVANEAGFYRYCANEPAAEAVAALMPPLVDARASDGALVLELVRGAREPWQVYKDHGPPHLPPEPPRELGRALGTLHRTFATGSRSTTSLPLQLQSQPPAYFVLHEPRVELLRRASPARLELCRLLQNEPAACAGLASARGGWRIETVIHGDVRSENVLVVGPATAPERVLLVDWEFVQLGDPAWDLAGAFEDHVRFWIESMSKQPDLDASERLATAQWPLAAVQTAVGCLCSGYEEAVGRPAAALAPTWIRAVEFSAVRMLQTAWEHCRHLDRLSSLSVLLLQVAVNILTDPPGSAAGFYDLEGRRS